jgi:CubicO group peptidase (beta-lactamase class C family)
VPIPEAARRLLDLAVADGVTPGAVLHVVGRDGADAHLVAGRRREGGPAVTADTRYDLASLTKVVATLPSVLRLVDAGEVALDDPVGRFFSSAGWFQSPSLADATVRALLAHVAGLPAWRPLFAEVCTRRTALAAVLHSPVAAPGAVVYSDLGFMLLGAIVERVAHERLDAFARREVFEPLGMSATRYGPLTGLPVAATEDCGWRDRTLEGEVHDENAVVWDGVAGHAGLFGTAADLARYARAWLGSDPRLGAEGLLAEATREQARTSDGASRGLGWALAPVPGTAAAEEGFMGVGASGFGHTGFTGTSLWIDPRAGRAVVLLTNRVHPRRGSPAAIQRLRRAVHAAVRAAPEASP